MTPTRRRIVIKVLRWLLEDLEAEESDKPRPPPKKKRREPTARDHAVVAAKLRKLGLEP